MSVFGGGNGNYIFYIANLKYSDLLCKYSNLLYI